MPSVPQISLPPLSNGLPARYGFLVHPLSKSEAPISVALQLDVEGQSVNSWEESIIVTVALGGVFAHSTALCGASDPFGIGLKSCVPRTLVQPRNVGSISRSVAVSATQNATLTLQYSVSLLGVQASSVFATLQEQMPSQLNEVVATRTGNSHYFNLRSKATGNRGPTKLALALGAMIGIATLLG